MPTKIPKRKTAVTAVATAEKTGVRIPFTITLQSIEIVRCTVERKVPRFLAPRGRVDTELSFTMEIQERNGKKGIAGLLEIGLTGKSIDAEYGTDSFVASFVLEGFFRLGNIRRELSDKDLTQSFAEKVLHELYPLSMMRATEFLAMIGYGGVRLNYGLDMEQIRKEMLRQKPQ
jgi:hypothetical protein